MRLMVKPYGNGGASSDPESVKANYETHSVHHVRAANPDDLEGMVREPNTNPDAGEPCGVASTDDMELKVLQPTVLSMGEGLHALSIEAHGTFEAIPPARKAPSRVAAQCLQEAAAMSASIAAAYRRRSAPPAARHSGRHVQGVSAPPQRGAHAANGTVNGAMAAPLSHHGDLLAHNGFHAAREVSAPRHRRAIMYAVPSGGALGLSRCYRMVASEEVSTKVMPYRRSGSTSVPGQG
jgi:hypothetical protein